MKYTPSLLFFHLLHPINAEANSQINNALQLLRAALWGARRLGKALIISKLTQAIDGIGNVT